MKDKRSFKDRIITTSERSGKGPSKFAKGIIRTTDLPDLPIKEEEKNEKD